MDKSYEKHVEDLIKVRSEIREAARDYHKGDHNGEAYRMCRAEAMADALGIEQDEFFLHKRLVEKEFGMVDTLLMGSEYKNNAITEVYNITEFDVYDNDFTVKTFCDKDSAQEYFNKRIQVGVDMDKISQDSYGNTIEECKKCGQFFVEDNENHGDVYIFLTKNTVNQ